MADFIPVPDTANLVLQYRDTVSGKEFVNDFAYVRETAWGEDQLSELCENAVEAWEEVMQGAFMTNITLIGAKAVSLESETAPYGEYVPAAPIAGTRTGNPIALHTCMSVTFRTGLRGRSYRGRVYHTGLANTDLATTKLWGNAAALAISNFYGSFLPVIGTSIAANHAVVSRYLDNAPRAVGVATVVTAILGRIKVATMRKRVA